MSLVYNKLVALIDIKEAFVVLVVVVGIEEVASVIVVAEIS